MRFRGLWLGLAALACANCGPAAPSATPSTAAPPAASDAANRATVIAAVESLFSAMRQRDTVLLKRLVLPDAQIVSIDERRGAQAARTSTGAAFITAIAAAADTPNERMWAPEVRLSANLATLWAPYEFHRGTTFSHCGHDAFHLIRQAGEWRILAVSYSVRVGPDCRR
jgi:hypothetical protein